MRILSFSLLLSVFCSGCASQTSNPAPFSANEINERTAGLRAPYDPSPTASFQRPDGADPFIQPPSQRPGSGVASGEARASRAVVTKFQRAAGNTPAGVATLYYKDESSHLAPDGHTMAAAADGARVYSGSGFVSLNVRAPFRGKLPLVSSQGRTYVVGNKGEHYSLVIHNALPRTVEVVLSVDGMDVVDGRPASYAKRGYVIDAGETATVDGFRSNQNQVRAFHFGDAPGAGVIGMAVFE